MSTIQSDPRIRWPPGLEPSVAPVFAHNELLTDVPAANIWAWLLEAPRWHEFYGNSKRLRIVDGSPRLRAGSRFTWWTFGVPVETTVDAFEERRQLSWIGKGAGSRGYHVWLIDPSPDGTGCKLVTEETQAGAVVRVLAPLLRRGLLHFHQRWLEGLARVAAGGPPGSTTTSR